MTSRSAAAATHIAAITKHKVAWIRLPIGVPSQGWRGTPPADDAEARKRSIERRGPRRTSLSDIAADLGVTRPTVYRYFATTDALFSAAAEVALGG